MTKNPPTDQEPTPSIEETLDVMSTAFLDALDAVGKNHARTVRTSWLGVTPTDRLGHARQVRVMFQAGLRKPVHSADLADLPRSALGLRP